MSRAFNLKMTQDEVIKHCQDRKIGISLVEPLPDGGVRLVCTSVGGAEQIRAKLHKRMIDGNPRRERIRPRTPLW